MKFGHFSQLFNKPGMAAYPRYEQMWQELELADELGFDYGFQSIHHFYKLRPNPSMYCAGGAARTKHMRLGPMGYIVGLDDPIRIVEEAFLLDNMLNGRFDLGLVLGVYPDYFRVYGVDGDKRRQLAEEAVLLLNASYEMKKGDLLNFEGPFHRYEEVEFAVNPVQKPGPPIWLASTRLETLQFLAREGVHGGYLHLHDRSEMAPRMKDYMRWWQEAGHPGRPNIGYLTFVYVDETDEEAVRKSTPWILQSTEEVYGRTPRIGGTYNQTDEKVGPLSSDIFQNKSNMEYLLERNLVMVGSPETVTRRIKAAASEGLLNTIFCEFNIGSIGQEDLMRSINLFGSQVIPALKGFDPTV